jgi:hypothetical protein
VSAEQPDFRMLLQELIAACDDWSREQLSTRLKGAVRQRRLAIVQSRRIKAFEAARSALAATSEPAPGLRGDR